MDNKNLGRLKMLYTKVFTTIEGKEVLKDLCNTAGFDKSPYVPNDTMGTGIKIGEHNMIRAILSKLDIPEDDLVVYMKNNKRGN